MTGSFVKGLMAQVQRAAQKRGQRTSTAHVLLVMVQAGTQTGQLLARRGVREGDLLTALKVVDDEPASALEVVLERAQKIASGLDEAVRPMHVLLAITRDGRTAGYRCLEQLGCSPARLREEIATSLGTRAEEKAAPRSTKKKKQKPSARPVTPRPITPPRRAASEAPTLSLSAEPERSPGSSRKIERAEPPAELEGQALPATEPPPASLRETVPAPEAGLPPELDPDQFPLLATLGRNLTELAAQGAIDPVVGRDREIEQLLDVLARRRANNPVLVGAPGVGKTAVVEGLALRLARGGNGLGGLEGRVIIEISAGALVSGTGVRGALADRMQKLREEVKSSEGRVLLFIDEIHAVVGGDGPDDLANELKSSLARGDFPCIGATTEAEYRRCFERDAALARRFSSIRIGEPSTEDALTIVRGIAVRYERHHAVAYADDALTAAVELSARYLVEQKLPDKAIAVLDLAGARVRRRGGNVVDLEAIASVIAEQAEVPVDRLLVRDQDRLLALEKLLEERLVGHSGAIARVADVLRKGAAGLRGKRPLGTFLLLGPTGVGKTEMAKAVADVVFPQGAMTRFDMSEMSEAHAVARLLGAPPGYVGHEEGGQLTEAVRRRPYQLLLLDEVEKAHPEVMLALLPMLDEGRLTDARGRTVDFTHAIVFMTTNLGADPSAGPGRIGFGGHDDARIHTEDPRAERSIASARAALPPELWNRIDETLYFAPLTRDEVLAIASRMLDGLADTLARERSVALHVGEGALDALVEAGGYDPSLGARPMRRVIGRLVEAKLAAAILSGELPPGSEVTLLGDGAEIRLDYSGAGPEIDANGEIAAAE